MKTKHKIRFTKNNGVSKTKVVLDLFKNNPKSVYFTKQLKTILKNKYNIEICTYQLSAILSRLYYKKIIKRSPTQLTFGFAYTLKNTEHLNYLYDCYLVPSKLSNHDYLKAEIIKKDFNRLITNKKLNVNSIQSQNFILRYGMDYFSNNFVLDFLASQIALLMFDGHIDKSVSKVCYYFRYKEDAIKFIHDFNDVFTAEKIRLEKAKYCYRVFVVNSYFAKLINCLGVPAGNKVHKEFSVPDWIIFGNENIKKSFICSAIGSEGSAPYNNRWRIQFVLSKCEEKIPNLLAFLNQIRNMLFHFGITTSYIQLRTQNRNRKYHGRFYIKGKDNLLKFYKHFKFAYASEKQAVLEDLLKRHNYI